MSKGKPDIGESIAGFNWRYEKELDTAPLRNQKANDILIVDDVNRIGQDALRNLFSLAEKNHARIVLLSPHRFSKGHFAGNPVSVLKKANVQTFQWNNDRNKEAAPIHVKLKEINDDEQRNHKLADYYASLRDSERSDTQVIARSKKESRQLNQEIRNKLKNKGILGRLEHTVHTLEPIYLSSSEKNLAHCYQKNGILRAYGDNGSFQDHRIVSIRRDRNQLTLRDVNDRQHVWNPKTKNDARFSHNRIQLFKEETLALAEGDQLISLTHQIGLGLKSARPFEIQRITKNRIIFSDGEKTRSRSLQAFKHSQINYRYATSLSTALPDKKHVIAHLKSYSLDQSIMNRLSALTQASLTVFTDDASKAQKRLQQIPKTLSAIDTVFESTSMLDRQLNQHSMDAIKQDIQTAINTLSKDNQKSVSERAVNFALRKITARQAGFLHKDLVREVLLHGLEKGVHHDAVMRVLQEKQQSGELIMGHYFNDGTRWTTQEALQLEQGIISNVSAGKGKMRPFLANANAMKNIFDDTVLTKDQKDACHLILTTKDQFIMVQGYAGTGKTSLFEQVKHQLPEGVTLHGLAPTHPAVAELRSLGISAQTLKSFILKKQNQSEDLSQQLILLDESSMVSNHDFAQFVSLICDGNGRVVISGDIAQHQAIESGKPSELLLRSNVTDTAYLTDIVRQENPRLKSAVQFIIKNDLSSAITAIHHENPMDHIRRDEKNPFFDYLTHSIVEQDDNQIQSGELPLAARVAGDYLSRTPDVQRETLVIVHAHQDREKINEAIRTGLKEQQRIEQTNIAVPRLVSNGLTDVEHEELKNYQIGTIIKYAHHYYEVIEKDVVTDSLLLKDRAGNTKRFYPSKTASKQTWEVYDKVMTPLSVGDRIRLTKTDKVRGQLANQEYQVAAIQDRDILLKSDDADKTIPLNRNDLRDAHWDYAYTITGYRVQGASKPFVIDYEVSFRKQLTNQRSFYIAVSRAKQHVIIYTDDKQKLLKRLLSNKGHQYAAKEVVGEVNEAEIISSQRDITSHSTHRTDSNPVARAHHIKSFNTKAILETVNQSLEPVLEKILGKPNQRLSSAANWRYGKKGSLSVQLSGEKRGLWHNFETGESGNLLQLIQKETGLPFKETLTYAHYLTGHAVSADTYNNKTTYQSVSPSTTKMSRYAKRLVNESRSMIGTLAEKYLSQHRHIHHWKTDDIRFHPAVYSREDQQHHPAMIAIGRDKNGQVQTVQAVYLDNQSANKVAALSVQKRTFGSQKGAMVSLQKSDSPSAMSFITEGIETGLSVREALKNGDVFAVLGKSNFRHLDPQSLKQTVVLCLDNDGPKTLIDPLIHASAKRLQAAEGKTVFIAMPSSTKTDFNDVIKTTGKAGVATILNNAIPYKNWEVLSQQFVRLPHENLANKGIQLSDITPNSHHFSDEAMNVILSDLKDKTQMDALELLSRNDQMSATKSLEKEISNEHKTDKEIALIEREIY